MFWWSWNANSGDTGKRERERKKEKEETFFFLFFSGFFKVDVGREKKLSRFFLLRQKTKKPRRDRGRRLAHGLVEQGQLARAGERARAVVEGRCRKLSPASSSSSAAAADRGSDAARDDDAAEDDGKSFDENERERERGRRRKRRSKNPNKKLHPPLSLSPQKQTNKQTQVPPSTSTPKPTSAPTSPPSNSSFPCSATITASSWQSGLLYYAALNIALTSPKVQSPLPYPVSLRIARAVTVDSAWNWSPAKVPTAGWVTGKVSESWQAMGEGKPASLGLIVAGSAADLRPTAVSVSGSFCTVAYA